MELASEPIQEPLLRRVTDGVPSGIGIQPKVETHRACHRGEQSDVRAPRLSRLDPRDRRRVDGARGSNDPLAESRDASGSRDIADCPSKVQLDPATRSIHRTVPNTHRHILPTWPYRSITRPQAVPMRWTQQTALVGRERCAG
ncbi:MAG TPA: hypothetical protein VFJ71_10645 [Candidatus Limnocylindrales bacterium]|nr:hypothetical protein [Candidatus Limnocylindrales bacterium]